MEWLNDKKNQPIVAAIAIAVIVVVGFCIYWFGFRKPPADTSAEMPSQTAATDSAPAGTQPTAPVGPGGPPSTPGATPPPTGQPGVASTPGAAGGQVATATRTPGARVASITPMETWRPDPFQPIGYKPPSVVHVAPPIRDFPFEQLFRHRRKKVGGDEKPEIQQPSRRMAGILLGDRVYAIIETNGATQVVQPGDYTTDRLAIVQRIEPDRVVLKTVDEKPRFVSVRMAASPTVQSPSGSSMQGTPGPNSYVPPGGRTPPPPPGMGGPPGGRAGEPP